MYRTGLFSLPLIIFTIILHAHNVNDTPYQIRIHAVRVSNDNGTYQADISMGSLKMWIDYANSVYDTAGLRFQFDTGSGSTDFTDLTSTLLNLIDSTEGSSDWNAQKIALDNQVAEYPGKLVVFFIYGDSSSGPVGGGFSWVKYNFIIMPGFNQARICGHQNIKLLAHEIGHYLGLSHTFEETFTSRDTLLKRIEKYSENYMDGDALSSTPPDPALYKDELRPMECYDPSGSNDTVYLNGILYRVPRNNIMSYYDFPYMTLTNQQIDIIHHTLLDHPFKKHLIIP